MSKCVGCGNDNAEGVKFCAQCGQAVVADDGLEHVVVASPKKGLLQNKALVFGGGGVLGLALIALLVVALIPFNLDAKTAEARLMEPKDFAFSASYASDPVTAADSVYPIFRASDKCTQDVDMQSMIKDQGTLLASSDYKENVSKVNSVHVDEDIIQFKDDKTASDFIALVKEGYTNPDCSYNSTSTYVDTTGVISDGSDVQTRLGVGGSNSYFLRYQSTMDVSGIYSFTIATDSHIAVVAKGRYVGIFRGTVDADTKSVSGDEMEKSLKVAITKMFG